jgi:hypothetical protein
MRVGHLPQVWHPRPAVFSLAPLPPLRRTVVPALCLALSFAVGACGSGGDNVSDTSGTRLPGGGPRPLEAGFVFKDGDLAPTRLKIAATDSVILVLSAADGRPHGVVVEGPGQGMRIVLRPSETIRRKLTGLRSGTRYRIVPDGASPPAVLQVG